jgi:uncharacterized protein YndB with AHSA1/START domain
METTVRKIIKVQVVVNALPEKVWKYFTTPEHIVKWNYASDDWHTPSAKADLHAGGRFLYRMEAKNGSMGFDLSGTFNRVKINELLEYTLDDERKVKVEFSKRGNGTIVTESFEAEHINSTELQRNGWQAILDNFKEYTETNQSKIK